MRPSRRVTRRDLFKKYFTFFKSADYKRYNNIVKVYYSILLDCIEMGYAFHSKYGYLQLITNERNSKNRRVINWAESIKYKNELIKEGKLPFKGYRNKEGEIIDNGGIKWHIYYDVNEPFFSYEFYFRGDYIIKYNAPVVRKRNRKEQRQQFIKLSKYAYTIKSEYIKQHIKDFQIR